MDAKLTFPNVEFVQTNGQRVRVRKSEVFTILLQGMEGPIWATTRDPLLSVTENGAPNTVNVVADRTGLSEIQVQDAARSVVFYLEIESFDPDEAARFDVPQPPVIEPVET